MSLKPFDKEFIKDLAELLSKCDLTEIELEHGESRLRVCREVQQQVFAPSYASAAYAPAAYAAPAPASAPVVAEAAAPVITGEKVTSPMVGTVYMAPEPSAPAFVKVGDNVQKGDTLLIVEAMKVMNNIPAPKSGVIKQILVSDKDAVEFGQTLMIIE